MGDSSAIQWTSATWNPLTGCDHVSPGCDNCYAAALASGRLAHTRAYEGLAANGKFNGTIRLLPDRLDQPLRWRRPRRIFVNSMSDLFHKDVPDEYIAQVFAVMAACPQHTFQVLTKRHARMRSLLNNRLWWQYAFAAACRDLKIDYANSARWTGDIATLPGVWLGVSVENQQWADIRIPALLDTPAAVRFLSAEPLIGPLDLDRYLISEPSGLAGDWTRGVDWVICGGESGQDARPMHPSWARSLRDQCRDAGVPFFMKQFGAWRPLRNGEYPPPGETRTLHMRGDKTDPILVREGGHNGDPERWQADLRVREYPQQEVAA